MAVNILLPGHWWYDFLWRRSQPSATAIDVGLAQRKSMPNRLPRGVDCIAFRETPDGTTKRTLKMAGRRTPWAAPPLTPVEPY